jgi:hypothetical protein
VEPTQTPFACFHGFLSSEVNGWNVKLIIHVYVVDLEPRVVAYTQKWYSVLFVGYT